MELIFATNNEHKIREIGALISQGFRVSGLAEAGISEDIPEDADTLEGNALIKARYVHDKTGMNVFADDTGLEVHALSGAPGVHSARYAGEDKDSGTNIRKLLLNLKGIEDRRARFRTVIALIFEDKEYLFEGTVEGHITEHPSGCEGFGYDPVFVPRGQNRTFAEMPLGEKNALSHRALAFAKLLGFLDKKSGR